MTARIVLGMWPISGDFGVVSLRNVEAIVKCSLDLGVASFDVAPNYGHGFAEMALGMILDGATDVDVYTKFGNHPFRGKDFTVAMLEASMEQSLLRLRRDKIKGVFLHNPRSEIDNYESIFDMFIRLKKGGQIEFSGLSGAKGFDYTKYGVEFEIYQQDANLLYMNELVSRTAYCKMFFARSPLATGLLSGKYDLSSEFARDDHRSKWLKGKRLMSLLRRIDVIRSVIGECQLPSVARRFLIHHPKVDFLVVGVSHPSHIQDIQNDIQKGPLDQPLSEALEAIWRSDFGLGAEDRDLGF